MSEIPIKSGSPPRALIHGLYKHPMSGEAIEARSFEIIDREAQGHGFAQAQWEIVRRMLHTTADYGLVRDIRFSDDAIESGMAALRSGAPYS